MTLSKERAEPVGYFGRFAEDDEDIIEQCSPNIKGSFPLYAAPPAPPAPPAPVVPDDARSRQEYENHVRSRYQYPMLERHPEDGSPWHGEYKESTRQMEWEDWQCSWNACCAAMLDAAPDFREISNSSTKHFRENAESSTNGWIKCSERMPDEGAEVYIFCDGEWVLEAQYREGDFYDVVRDGSEVFETVARCVSHWQPRPQRPAAPGKEG